MNKTVLLENQIKNQMQFSAGEKVWAACSGGPDSVALLHLLSGIQSSCGIKLGVIHFNHGIRGKESDRDALFVKNLAEELQIPFQGGRSKVKLKSGRKGLSLEEAAREARYSFFIKIAKKHRVKKIAVAHTLDDQAETVLMRMIQGTGPRGLLGIRSKMKIDGVTFVRPLLEISKKTLTEYLKTGKIQFRRDSSNRSNRFFRNRIRQKLFPYLKKEFNPKVVNALARIPSIVQDESELFHDIENQVWKDLYRSRRKHKLFLHRDVFLKAKGALQFRLMDRALKTVDPRSGLGYDAWQRLKPNLLRKRYQCSLPRDIDLILTSSRLVLYKKKLKQKK